MSGSSFKLKGGADLLDLLDELPKKWAVKVARGGARAAAVVIQKDAQARVGRRTGRVAKTIKVTTRTQGDLITSKVKMKGYYAFIGIFLEYGVKAHEIAPKKKGALVVGWGSDIVRSRVHHPGFGEQPFMRPALDAKAKDAVNVFGEYIRGRLTWNTLKAPTFEVQEDDE